ncbi:MAG: mechanosensitive ion channel family protein [Verrucomicrobiales bacterium]|nr:mechanosensitive ion channel family protein [Verrucomicrobiales bacterium]
MEETSTPIKDNAVKAIEDTAEAVTRSASTIAERLNEWLDSIQWIPDAAVNACANTILLAALLTCAWFIYIVFRPLILTWVKHIIAKTPYSWDDQLLGHGVFRWITHLLPGIFVILFAPGFFKSTPIIAKALDISAELYLLLSAYFIFDSLFNAIKEILQRSKVASHLNLTAIGQIAKLITALVIFLLCIATILQEPPIALLSGLGVLASVIMLVFKDVILGFVAGIQLSTNKMLSVGDWLEMPSHSADGDVEEIGLTTVKVRNFDRTITTVPTYALISQSFKNWRGMSESEGRRIKRSVLIDTNSIQLVTPEMVKRFHEIEHISAYFAEKEKEVTSYNARISPERIKNRVNGRRLTNVGTFRAYIEGYLRNHPDINQEMTLLVRQLAPDGRGLPIEIYCFSSNKNWAAYESIQADIFDHLFAVAPEFDLRIFQEPSGSDFRTALTEQTG